MLEQWSLAVQVSVAKAESGKGKDDKGKACKGRGKHGTVGIEDTGKGKDGKNGMGGKGNDGNGGSSNYTNLSEGERHGFRWRAIVDGRKGQDGKGKNAKGRKGTGPYG